MLQMFPVGLLAHPEVMKGVELVGKKASQTIYETSSIGSSILAWFYSRIFLVMDYWTLLVNEF